MTTRRDYLASFLAAFLLHAGLLAVVGRGLPGGGLPAAARVPAAAPLAVSLLPAAAAPVALPVPPAPRAAAAPAPAAEASEAAPEASAPAADPGPARPERLPARKSSAAGRVRPRLACALSPVFPLSSRRRGEEGDVRLKVLLSAAGRIRDILLLDSSGFAALDRSALRAARRASFVPALEGGQPVAGELVIRVRFRLEES